MVLGLSPIIQLSQIYEGCNFWKNAQASISTKFMANMSTTRIGGCWYMWAYKNPTAQ